MENQNDNDTDGESSSKSWIDDKRREEALSLLLVKYEKGCVRSIREVAKVLDDDYGIKLSPSSIYRRLVKSADEEKEAALEKNDVYNNLLKQYDEGIIQTQKELRKRVSEATGLTLSIPTLSRHLKLLRGGERKKRDIPLFTSAFADVPSVSATPTDDDMIGTTPSEVKYRSLSRKLNSTILTIGEMGGVRQYQRLGVSSDGSKEYFRCGTCYRHSHKNGGGVVAYLTVRDGHIVGNAHPKHNENCRLISEEKAAIQALDRQSRKDVRTGKKAPRDAHAVGFERVVRLAESSGGPPGRNFSMPAMYPSWNKVRRSYYRARRYALRQNAKTEEENSPTAEHNMPPSGEDPVERVLLSARQNFISKEAETIDSVSQLSSPGQVVSSSTCVESVEDSGITNDSVDELLALEFPSDNHSSSPADEDKPGCIEIPQKSSPPSAHDRTPPLLSANVPMCEHTISEERSENAALPGLAENASTFENSILISPAGSSVSSKLSGNALTSEYMAPENAVVNSGTALLRENISTYKISTLEPCTSNTTPVLPSKRDSVFANVATVPSVRRHILTRDPRTGRIVVKGCASTHIPTNVIMPRSQTLTSTAESIFGHRTVQANDSYKRAGLKRRAAISSKSEAGTPISSLVQLSKQRAMFTLENGMDSPLSDSVRGSSPSAVHSTPSNSVRTRESSRQYEKPSDTLSAIEALLDKAGNMPKDQYDKIGDSVADSLRRVCEENMAVGVKFKCELLQMMAKYETMAFAK